MFEGRLAAIYVAPHKAAPMQALVEVEAVPGGGLVGDRFALPVAKRTPRPEQEVTLIEREAIEAAEREYGLEFAECLARRNLVTMGVPLNHLVGRQFAVGAVVLRGLELCEPCGHLEKLTLSGIRKALTHRGGLRAQIVAGGVLRVGDLIRPSDEDA